MRHDNSDPYLTNEYIDELIQNVQQHEEIHERLTDEPDLRLAYDIRRAYQDEVDHDRRSLENVLLKLIGNQVTAQPREITLAEKNLPQEMYTNASHWEIEEISTLRSYGAKQPEKNARRSFKRRLGMGIAAAAILALVLSWPLIFSGRPQVPSTATGVNPTATPTAPYPSFPKLAFHDPLTTRTAPWGATECPFVVGTGLQPSVAIAGDDYSCLRSGIFGEMAYQATMTITRGDCGGLIFRYVDQTSYAFVYICNETHREYAMGYDMGYVVHNQGWVLFPKDRPDPAIHQSLSQPNVLGVTIRGDEVDIYINGHMVTSMHQAFFTGPLSHGSVGLVAIDFSRATSVTFTDAILWTAD